MSRFSAAMAVMMSARRQAVGGKPILMENDLQFTDLPAGHFHAANSGDREELWRKLVLEPVPHLDRRTERGAEASLEDRNLAGVDLADPGRLYLARQLRPRALEQAGRVLQRDVDVRADLEVERHVRAAFGGAALEAHQTFGARKVAFEHARDLLLHDLRSRARVVHRDADLRIGDFREQVHRQPLKEEHAEDDDDQRERERADRAADRDSRNAAGRVGGGLFLVHQDPSAG